MLLVTTEFLAGVDIEMLGLVKGSTIQTVNFVKDFGASLKTIVGGELKHYTQMMDEARRIATDRMIIEASAMGADAIVGVRFATSAVMTSAAEIMAYGTAVRYRR
ncbi:MAG: YbjQ family protein [Ruminiclostridium sp.]|nr:YbjQ family protein [Ruminiclostridium sp.]